jgi:hypothetical protein
MNYTLKWKWNRLVQQGSNVFSASEEIVTMKSSSAESTDRRKRAVGAKAASASAPRERSDIVMMRYGPIEEMDRSFDIDFWQRQGDAAIFRAAWELVESSCRDRGMNPDELRLQRSVEAFQRP